MSFKRWNVKNADEAAISKLADALGVSSLTARALAARGFADPASARAFLAGSDPSEDPLHIQDIDKAAARTSSARCLRASPPATAFPGRRWTT